MHCLCKLYSIFNCIIVIIQFKFSILKFLKGEYCKHLCKLTQAPG